jgi:GntR family transcriptional regulator, transcriptional repressor for pyruvate dehydrogenase complex
MHILTLRGGTVLSEREQLECGVLTILKGSVPPMGCGSIRAALQSQGYSISDATIGRILREMDIAGLTDKAGYRGRTISTVGIARLAELANKDRRLKWGDELAKAVQGHTKEQLLEVLVARRVIEGELAYLAAQNATNEERQCLAAVLRQQRETLGKGEGAATEDVEFHNIITDMARNRVLAAAVAVIRQDTQLSPVLEYIRKHVHSLVYVDHQKIFQNIADGQPEGAKAAMIEHINSLIADVGKYWELIAKQ